MLPLNTNYYNRVAVSDFFLFFIFFSSTYIIPAVAFTSGHCHHLSVECLALAPTGKSYPPLRQEMQEAFRPELVEGLLRIIILGNKEICLLAMTIYYNPIKNGELL